MSGYATRRVDSPHLLRCRWCEFTVSAQGRGRRGGLINGMDVLTKHSGEHHREQVEKVGAAASARNGRLESAAKVAEDAMRACRSYLPRMDDDAEPRS